jgi:hypothetical protein
MKNKKNCKTTRKCKGAEPPREFQPIAFVQQSVLKPGTSSARRFEHYKFARTIHEARQLGASSHDLKRDLRNGILVQAKRLEELGIVRAISIFAPADNERITFAPNPKKPGFAAYERYERYSGAKTMLEAKKRGIWPGDIAHDIRSGYLGSSLTPFSSMGFTVTGFKKYRASKGSVKPPGSSPVAKRSKATAKTATTVNSATKGIKKVGIKRRPDRKSSFAKAWNASVRAAPLAWTKMKGWA